MNARSVSPCRVVWNYLSCVLLTATILCADTTFSFQNGTGGYAGAKDLSINTQYAQYNGGNGVSWKSGAELGVYTVSGSSGYTARYLLKFGGLNLPAGSAVVSATLTLGFDYWGSGSGNLTGSYLKNSWDPASNNIGWIHRDSSQDWASPGASAAGVDTIPGKSFRVPALRAVGNQLVTIALDRDVVQSWVDTPSANQGILLVNNLTGDIVNVLATGGTAKWRPLLTIVVASSTAVQVSLSPASTTLQPGQTQAFAATVTGSSNTSVTWTATGGTITSNGVFTAGSATGNFTVKATSVADNTKSATATVTIQPAPVVSVSVSPASATLQPGQTQAFTATVTGSSNTSVTWTATGGTIISNGVYTAGSTTGNFIVKATSVADNTKSATATVTIQPAPVVSVSVSPGSTTLQPGQTQAFTATATGSSNTSVTWTATGGTITSNGFFTAGSATGNFSVKATSVADPSASATASIQIVPPTTSSLPPVPRMVDGAYVVVQSPVSGMHFTAPATIRIYADPYDPNATNDPDAITVTFLVDGQPVGSYTGSSARNGYFPWTVNHLTAGTHAITTQISSGGRTVTSFPVTVYVDNPTASTGPTFNLGSDVVLSGSQSATYAGTPDNHCTINGNGFQIRSGSGFTGSLTISNCDVRNLGTDTKPAIDMSVNGSGSIQITGSVFENFGTVAVAANDSAQLAVRNNEFRENTLVPVTSLPIAYGGQTLPVVSLSGNSSVQKYFQGNNVGLSTVFFHDTRNWLIGGSTDAESNVLMGVRCGFTVSNSSGMVLRGNYSQHNYPHRFSQGDNFQLEGDGFLVEHNIIRSSSWPVRAVGGELRYNLIDASGNSDQVIQGPMANTNMHHNVITFTVSQTFYGPGAGLRVMYNADNVQFNNNTMDGGGTFMNFSGSPITVLAGAYIGSLRNNVFYNFQASSGLPILAGDFGESTNPPLPRLRYADYNAFYNPDAPSQVNYGLGVVGKAPGSAGFGLHDLGGFNGHMNPKFTAPTALPFPFAPQDIWMRIQKVSDVLSTYRAMYAPAVGSPLVGAGDPQDGAGGNIGAVGNGEASDRFGKFGTGN